MSLRLDWCRLVLFPQVGDETLCRRVSDSAGYFRGHRAPIEHRDRQPVLDLRTRRGSGEGVEAADFWSADRGDRLPRAGILAAPPGPTISSATGRRMSGLQERTRVSSAADGVSARRAGAVACWLLALCNMRTLYLRNVPDDVVRRLERLAARDGTSVGAVAVRELADVTRRADNPSLLGLLPDLDVDVTTIVADLSGEREQR
jgi:hypothetical protein